MNHQGQRPLVFAGEMPFPRDFGPCGAKYAFIDFGESKNLRVGEEMHSPSMMGFNNGTAAPELYGDNPVDVFCL